MTIDLRDAMDKATRDQIKQLAKIRSVRFVDAAVCVAQTFAENLRDSRETSMEDYWEKMVLVADGIVAQETGVR